MLLIIKVSGHFSVPDNSAFVFILLALVINHFFSLSGDPSAAPFPNAVLSTKLLSHPETFIFLNFDVSVLLTIHYMKVIRLTTL